MAVEFLASDIVAVLGRFADEGDAPPVYLIHTGELGGVIDAVMLRLAEEGRSNEAEARRP